MARTLCLLVVAVALLDYIKAQALPYNPSTIFLSPKNANTAYVFLSSTSTSSRSQLAFIDISSSLQSSNLPLKVLTTDLPFLQGDNAGSTAFTTSLSASGTIGVYAGSCASSSSFWVFNPANTSLANGGGNSTWTEMSTTRSPVVSTAVLPNANFLASAFSFSTLVDSNDTQRTVYIFGGMCPKSPSSNVTLWQSAASYSNSMLKLSSSPSSSYQLSLTSSASHQPIAEAGFTITATTPTYLNSSIGIVTQAQNFVLLGGHTKTAFINMSQVALFSLPQENWSFYNVGSALSAGSTEFAVRSTASTAVATPDPRSGHTAILSSDGTAIIVFGGWVGDVDTAAEPQLAILRLGSGFGGAGSWAWEIPSTTGAALSSGEGIYGHGAIMLPGNVMMVAGGYNIAAPGASKTKRSNSGTEALFLNVTSMSWVTSYTNPSYVPNSSSPIGSGNARNIRLGVGLGLGLTVVIAASIFYCWYSRKLKRRREVRERDLQALSQSAHEYYMNDSGRSQRERVLWDTVRGSEMSQREGIMPWPLPTNNLGSRTLNPGKGRNTSYGLSDSYGDNSDSAEQSLLHTTNSNRGISLIPRKPISSRNARGHYQPTPNGLSHSNIGTAGVIHPIYEADEDIDVFEDPNSDSVPNEDDHIDLQSSESGQDVGALGTLKLQNPRPISDPFTGPPTLGRYVNPARGSATRSGIGYEQQGGRDTPSPVSSAQARDREIKEWVADWAAAGALLSPQSRTQSLTNGGRVSPTKDNTSVSGRTESNLSERSITTARSLSLSRNNSGRNNSLTAFFAGNGGSWNPFMPSGSTAIGLESVTMLDRGEAISFSEHLGGNGRRLQPPLSAGSGTSSFATAHTTHSGPGLRVEAEHLMSQPHDYVSEGSPSKTKAVNFSKRQEGWLGSLKRVFAGRDEDRPGSHGSSSAQSSPTREYNSGGIADRSATADVEPRRAASAASATAMMWRRKQGRGDWEDSAEPIHRSNTFTTNSSGRPLSYGLSDAEPADEEDDWDIERAVERRVVQVMFTVPKEKLRVVNHDVVDMDGKSEAGSLHGGDTSGESVQEKSGGASRSEDAKGKGKGKVKSIVDGIENGGRGF